MKKDFLIITAMMFFLLSACGQDAPDTQPVPDNTDSITAKSNGAKAPATATADSKTTNAKTAPESAKHASPEQLQAGQAQETSPHNAMNSLDYFGTYLADIQDNRDGIVQLSLHQGGSCLIVMQNGGKIPGTYRWDVTGSVIHIDAEQAPKLSFFVGEGFVILGDTTAQGEGLRFTQQPGAAVE